MDQAYGSGARQRPGDVLRARIGYVGLGDMGGPMATNLARDGLDVRVFDVRSEAHAGPVAAGAHAATGLVEIAETCDVVHVCVTYGHQVEAVVTAADGLVDHGHPGQVIIIHSTTGPAVIEACARAAEAAGIDVVDAAVTGGSERAAAGDLTLLVGGAPAAVSYVMPLLSIIGSSIHHVGPPGTGQVVKLINNVMGEVSRLVYLEALTIAEAYGIDETVVHTAVSTGSGMSYSQLNIARFDSRPTTHAHLGLEELPYRFTKDLWHALELGRGRRLELPLTALSSQIGPDAFRERWRKVASRERDSS